MTHANLFPFISDNFFVVGDIMVSEGEMYDLALSFSFSCIFALSFDFLMGMFDVSW